MTEILRKEEVGALKDEIIALKAKLKMYEEHGHTPMGNLDDLIHSRRYFRWAVLYDWGSGLSPMSHEYWIKGERDRIPVPTFRLKRDAIHAQTMLRHSKHRSGSTVSKVLVTVTPT